MTKANFFLTKDTTISDQEQKARFSYYTCAKQDLTDDEWDRIHSENHDFVFGFTTKLENELIKNGCGFNAVSDCITQAQEMAARAFGLSNNIRYELVTEQV